ncbi:MAG: alpha/beta hydrolase [Gammaproteobacteria bacterium]|nr:alpha/beta hydrolase [Gammaproteobacteria bacterium]
MTADAVPFWFDRALRAPSEKGDLQVAGTNIHYEAWGDNDRPGVVLAHGSNAHLEWWRFVAPFLADNLRVVALDSSGNGSSGWRERYSGDVFAEEVMAVADAAIAQPKPFVVGHSFGGFVALQAGYGHGERLGGIVFVDFTVMPPEAHFEWGGRAEKEGKEPRRTRVYDSLEAALARFRLLPEQPVRHPAVMDWIARNSLRPVEGAPRTRPATSPSLGTGSVSGPAPPSFDGTSAIVRSASAGGGSIEGWTWKFDPTLFDHLEMGGGQRDQFLAMPCRSALVVGEDSEDEGVLGASHMAEITNHRLPIVTMPGTHHHLMFEEPLALAMALKGILLSWVQEE